MKQAVLILLALLTSACSLVFEDRSSCPCLLTIDYSPCNRDSVDLLESFMIEDERVLCREAITAPFSERRISVKKGTYLFSSWGNCAISDDAAEIYPDARIEPYSFCCETVCLEDTCRISVRLRPEFTDVSVRIIDSGEEKPEARLTGCNTGFTGKRDFLSDEAVCRLELYRQPGELVGKTNLLRMKDVGTLGIRLTRGEKHFDYPAGQVLKENGYDMEKEILDPIEIVIDTTESEITIKTLDWEYVDSTEITF